LFNCLLWGFVVYIDNTQALSIGSLYKYADKFDWFKGSV